MDKIQKPTLKFSTVDKLGTIFGIVLPLITYRLTQWYWAIILLLFILCTILIYHLFTYNKQINSLYDEYSKTYNNHIELAKQFEVKSKTLMEKENLLCIYNHSFSEIEKFILSGLIPASDYEINYLKKMHTLISDEKAFLYNIERGLENGRKNI